MTAKEYLLQIARAQRHIDMLKRDLNDLHLQMYPSGMDFTADRVQSSHNPDKFGSLVAKMDETEARIISEIGRLLTVKEYISKQIRAMPNARTAEILHCRYVLLLRWEDIARQTSTDLRWVYRLHGQGLTEFERQYRGKMKFAIKSH